MGKLKNIILLAALLFACSVAFAQTVKITTFNVQWLGCPSYNPADDQLQIKNVAEVIKKVDADIVALQEITMKPVNSLEALLEHLGSDWAGAVKLHTNNDCHQDMGIIYKKASVTLTSSVLIGSGWARNPALYSVNVTKGGRAIPLEIVNIHAKAYNDEKSYNARVSNSTSLKKLLDGGTYNAKNIVLIGDYNDYLLGSQCGSCGDSPYKNFVNDTKNYKALTGNLQNPNYNNPVIDNIIISNELFNAYVSNSVILETAVTKTISGYRSTTSDHTPVSITLDFGNATAAPKNTYTAQLLLYPNPTTNGELTIENGEWNAGTVVKIYNLSGTLLATYPTVGKKTNINISQLPSGLYVVSVCSEKGEVGSKLVIRE